MGTHLAVCLVAMLRCIAMKKEFAVRPLWGLPFVEVEVDVDVKRK
jgi:hypothetical protein